MDDDLDPLTDEQHLPPAISHRRLLVKMVVVIAAGAILGTLFANLSFGIGVIVGGAASFANYFWQRNSTRAIFDAAVSGRQPIFLGARYLLRYVAIGLFVAFFYYSSLLPVTAIILGLASFALAVVIEGITGIFTTSNRQEF
ncbi:MAG: ATP synthase subunit I [Acidobacteriota bacterium]